MSPTRPAGPSVPGIEPTADAPATRPDSDLSQVDTLRLEFESFLHSASHDIRAPLRAIDGYSFALTEEYSDHLDATGRDYLRRIRHSTERLRALIDGLAELSLVAVQPVEVADVDLSRLAAAVAAKLQKGDPDRRVEVSIAPGLRIAADPSLLRIMLENLIGNAWNFTTGVEAASIEIRSDDSGNSFRVTDNGAGFDMAFVGRLFTPFQRLHGQAAYAGSGLGLAVVRRIAERHGGTVRIHGVVNEGATCEVGLPTVASAA